MPLAELLAFFETGRVCSGPPVREMSKVSAVEADSDGRFLLSLADKQVRARTVVVASGSYHKAHRPAGADTLPSTVHQVLAEDYGSPAKLPPGNVLIIGSGQTGCQLAAELHEPGRNAFLACRRCPLS